MSILSSPHPTGVNFFKPSLCILHLEHMDRFTRKLGLSAKTKKKDIKVGLWSLGILVDLSKLQSSVRLKGGALKLPEIVCKMSCL